MDKIAKLKWLLSLSVLLASGAPLEAEECCGNRFYVGAFGGGLYSNSTDAYQLGTVFFLEAEGGPLEVYAHGKTRSITSGFGGVQVGYELSTCPWVVGCSGWSLSPAVELEGFWYSHTKKGHLINATERPLEGDFLDSFHMNSGVYLANVVFSLNNSCCGSIVPYVGGGLGASRISIKHAKSLQTDPEEVGINHFNELRHDSSWAFAAQAKVGLRYQICGALHIFGEYRYLFVDSSKYIFGSTNYPAHATTSPWNVKVYNINYNAIVFGIQYDL